ncbi:MAG: hypothetical protein PHW53_05245 [Patescibacteria group bacterium]|nr:hypothetical protein [Patescibacteria group bacterium]
MEKMFILFLLATIIMILIIVKSKIRLFSMYFFAVGALTPLISFAFCFIIRSTALPAKIFWTVSPLALILCVLSSIAGIIEISNRKIPRNYLYFPIGGLVCSLFLWLFLAAAWAMVNGA